jgi:hypothetical protein
MNLDVFHTENLTPWNAIFVVAKDAFGAIINKMNLGAG